MAYGDTLARLASLPGVADAIEEAREACTALRWHPALRRRADAAQAESVVRGARASAALEGAELPLSQVRELVAAPGLPRAEAAAYDPVTGQVLGALRGTAAAAHLGRVLSTAPAQALARLHLAVTSTLADVNPADVGRPRPPGVAARDLVELGPAPDGPALARRLADVSRLLTAPTTAPALVVAAVAHAELVLLRPFVVGNGLVARAVARAVVVTRGLDPTGVCVPEVGWLSGGSAAYLGGIAAYAGGEPDAVALWLRQCAGAVTLGAREGWSVADAVQAGQSAGS